MLVKEYELFKVNEHETISQMYERFTNIVSGLMTLGKEYSNVDLVSKILNSLPKTSRPKVTAVEEAQDLGKLELSELIGSLTAYEDKLRTDDDEQPKRRKYIALKSKIVTNDLDEEEMDDQIAFLTKQLEYLKVKRNQKTNYERQSDDRKIFCRRNAFQSRNSFKPENEKSQMTFEKGSVTCFRCGKTGHLRADYPNRRINKEKAVAATWSCSEVDSDDSGSDEDQRSFSSAGNHKALMAISESEKRSRRLPSPLQT